MKAFENSETALVADVDCTADGKPLCTTAGVKGYPTLKYGDPNDLQDYSGGRDFDALQKFASENLKPVCGISNLDLCNEEETAEFDKFMNMPLEELKKEIAEKEKQLKDTEETFNTESAKLQDTYTELQKTKEDAIAAVKEGGLGRQKSVKAFLNKQTAEKQEL